MKKGFTLAELTIVIIIIAILAAIAIPQFIRVQERAKVSAAIAKLDMIRKAESIYHSLYDNYTDDFDELATEVPEVAADRINTTDWSFEITNANETAFTAEATRQRGAYANKKVTINQDGEIGGDHPMIATLAH